VAFCGFRSFLCKTNVSKRKTTFSASILLSFLKRFNISNLYKKHTKNLHCKMHSVSQRPELHEFLEFNIYACIKFRNTNVEACSILFYSYKLSDEKKII